MRRLLAAGIGLLSSVSVSAAITCTRTLTAEIAAIDQPLVFNRLGAQNINGMVFALWEDLVNGAGADDVPLKLGGAPTPGDVQLRRDKRPRPLVLRIAAGECLKVTLHNLLTPDPNPRNGGPLAINEQVADRTVSFTVPGMELVEFIDDDGSFVGTNRNNTVPRGESRTYTLHGAREGVFVAHSYGATFGGEATIGNASNGLFGQVVVLPPGARAYRNTLTEEEMRLATTGRTSTGQPIINYEARYPNGEPWTVEGKAGRPIINMVDGGQIVHADMDAVVMGPNADGSFPPSTYPLESTGKRNPSLPNRLEAFRDFSVAFHDEVATAQAFPGFFDDPVMGYVLDATGDGFMINYGGGGIGSEVIANRLGVGPMHDCLSCAFEEFFLTSHVLGDPAMLVDTPANVGLESLGPNDVPHSDDLGIKALKALFPADPSNVHHSYIGDFVKMRNTHIGKEQHIFHLHNHQWLFNPNDDNSNYIDAQGIGPGSGYTYEIAFGGSGNRNKTAGDAIYHCHFYPHFAQGMWYLWRVHDVFEEGTRLAVSETAGGFHETPFALGDGTPADDARALPDGEIIAGTPIPAIVPLPGKPMPPIPGTVRVVPKLAPDGQAVGSIAQIDRSAAELKNPGFPFWVAGLESTVGQRPPTPPLDMLDAAKATLLKNSSDPLWAAIDPAQAGGFDGGLPRHALDGYSAGGTDVSEITKLSVAKHLTRAKAVFFDEEGTDVEQAAMRFHARRTHPSFAMKPDGTTVAGDFITNGSPPVAGAPFQEPCIDDNGKRLTASAGAGVFFSGESLTAKTFTGSSFFTADRPRTYKAANIQFDAVFNKVGYHYPQERMLALWEDALRIIDKQKPPEPLVMRMNTFDCTMYHHTNLVPEIFEWDDYQVRTPTDIIGQHIHLPKWDLTTADGSGNGWNYEDGTLAPGAVRERIDAIRLFNGCGAGDISANCPVAKAHPVLDQRPEWLGARTTMQRWFADPVVNVHKVDRGLGNIFTHDHFSPSTHQQIGLYATVLTEPAGSSWYHSELGYRLGNDPASGAAAPDPVTGEPRQDGGPTSWQAVIATGDLDGDGKNDSYREFFLEYTDFQHAYEAGVYVGAGPDGIPSATLAPTAETFRYAINPPGRIEAEPVLPDLTLEPVRLEGCERPCPRAIDGDDPGMFAVNYRNEPIGLRVYDPDADGPDGVKGMQKAGPGGDLAFAFQSRTDRAIAALNASPADVLAAVGPKGGTTTFPPHINAAGALPGDPFTPMLRTYAGDRVRIRVQAGGHEEEHDISLHGVKWLQGGSGHGFAPNSGWKASQAAGISEQFTFAAPVFQGYGSNGVMADYMYSIDSSIEGYWSGVWGLMRNYNRVTGTLHPLPNNPKPIEPKNAIAFNGICPKIGVNRRPTPIRRYEVVVALANDILGKPARVTIPSLADTEGEHVGAALDTAGGTLLYNPREAVIPAVDANHDGEVIVLQERRGPLNDPTAILYVLKSDLDATGKLKAGQKPEPLVLRAAAGDCIEVTLENRLPAEMPDLPTYATMLGAVKRDRLGALGATTFNNNLMRPSAHVGLHTQLLAYDVTRSDGLNVGINPEQTVPPRASAAAPYPTRTYQFYAGDLSLAEFATAKDAFNNVDSILAYPVEFGAGNIRPADYIKQVQKGLGGAVVIEPFGARWVEDAGQHAAATVMVGASSYRDIALVWQRALNPRWADGDPVPNLSGEGPGVPEDPQDNSGVAINYGTEPAWFRFGKQPNAPFGHAAGNAGFGDIGDAHRLYSNALVGGDPATPVFSVQRGKPFRMHVVMPSGGSRNGTFALHGHLWPRDPYLAQNVDAKGYPMKFFGVGSTRIGSNPMAMYLGGQENVLPGAHWSFVFDSAGGGNGVTGDYLYRDVGSFGHTNGFWGIVRVTQ